MAREWNLWAAARGLRIGTVQAIADKTIVSPVIALVAALVAAITNRIDAMPAHERFIGLARLGEATDMSGAICTAGAAGSLVS